MVAILIPVAPLLSSVAPILGLLAPPWLATLATRRRRPLWGIPLWSRALGYPSVVGVSATCPATSGSMRIHSKDSLT